MILEGTTDSLVSHCVFNGVGGNALMIKNFNRNATVADSELVPGLLPMRDGGWE